MRLILLTALLASFLAARPARAQESDIGDGTRVSGTLTFTCRPDPKSEKAGAKPFDDTLEMANDRVKSKALSAEGFPVALSIPSTINGVVTFKAVFKKKGATATYFIRAKQDGAVSGSFTRVEGGKTQRYLIGATFQRAQDAQQKKPVDAKSPGLDPAVLKVDGAFVRLMSAQVAFSEARVKVDKDAANAMLKKAGADHIALRGPLLARKMTVEEYVKQAEARLAQAWQSLAELVGKENVAKAEASYAKPYTGTYVHLNRMRAAVADLGGGANVKRADQAVYQHMVNLAVLARQPTERTPAAIAKIKSDARADVLALLNPQQTKLFERMVAGMEADEPAAETTRQAGDAHK